MRLLAPLVILLLVSACGGGGDRAGSADAAKSGPAKPDAAKTDAVKPDAAKPDAAKPDAAKPDAKPDAAKPAKKPKPEPLSGKQAGELSKQFHTALEQGRKLTKAGDHEGGIKHYHEALAIEPSNAAALAELGWAALLANQLDLAQGATSQALTFSRKPEQQGMILYNLGRVAEARGLNDEAITQYRESLERRPNATVQTRLDGLLATTTVAPVREGLPQLASAVADLGAACKLLADQKCVDLYTMNDNACTCTAPKDEGGGWALLELGEADSQNLQWYPAVKTSTGWIVFDTIAWIYNPGMMGIFEEVQWTPPALLDLLPGGESEWVLAFHKDRGDSDMGVNEYESETYSMTVVCAREGADAWCTAPLLRDYTYTRDVEFEDAEYEGADEIEHEGLPINTKFSCELELGSKVTVTNVVGAEHANSGWLGDARGLTAGEHELATLLGKPAAAK
jgi:tetratricopeptide (TPR) repeat protein